jgi:tetratricopeptide (TPR) repeat protein
VSPATSGLALLAVLVVPNFVAIPAPVAEGEGSPATKGAPAAPRVEFTAPAPRAPVVGWQAVAAQDPLAGVERTVPAFEELVQRLEGEYRVGEAPSARALGMALRELALLRSGEEEGVEAIALAQRAVAFLREGGDEGELAQGYNRLGVTHWILAQYDSAVVNLQQAVTLAPAVEDSAFLGRVYNNLGTSYYQWGHYDLAMEAFVRALSIREEVGDRPGVARVRANLGLTYRDWGRMELAEETLLQARDEADALGEVSMQGYARTILGDLYRSWGRLADAEEVYRASLEYYSADHAVPSLVGLARVLSATGRADEAVILTEELLSRVARPRGQAVVRLALAEALQADGRLNEAEGHLQEGLTLAREWEQRPLTIELLDLLVRVREARGDDRGALAIMRESQALRDTLFGQNVSQRMAALEVQALTQAQERENLLLREEQRVQEELIRRQRLVGILGGGFLLATLALVAALVHFNRRGREREALLHESHAALEETNRSLVEALDQVRTLEGLIPICSNCKRVRGDTGYWEAVESYITARSAAHFSHSICTDCGPELYGEDWEDGAPSS